MKLYILNLLLGLDEFANTLTGGAPSETISGRCIQAKLDGDLWGRILYRFLDWLQPGHCETALVNDKNGRHKPSV